VFVKIKDSNLKIKMAFGLTADKFILNRFVTSSAVEWLISVLNTLSHRQNVYFDYNNPTFGYIRFLISAELCFNKISEKWI